MYYLYLTPKKVKNIPTEFEIGNQDVPSFLQFTKQEITPQLAVYEMTSFNGVMRKDYHFMIDGNIEIYIEDMEFIFAITSETREDVKVWDYLSKFTK